MYTAGVGEKRVTVFGEQISKKRENRLKENIADIKFKFDRIGDNIRQCNELKNNKLWL